MSKPTIVINKVSDPEYQHLSMDDYNKLLKETTARFAACHAHEIITRKNALADMLFMGYKPPTRWQKFKYRIANYKQRCKDIWTILCGRDVHEDCGQ